MKKRSTPGHRSRRAAEAVRETVTAFLSEEARDPRIGMVTVTNVHVTGDLQRAVVSFVVHGDEQARRDTLEGLSHAASAVRRPAIARWAKRPSKVTPSQRCTQWTAASQCSGRSSPLKKKSFNGSTPKSRSIKRNLTSSLTKTEKASALCMRR